MLYTYRGEGVYTCTINLGTEVGVQYNMYMKIDNYKCRRFHYNS